MLSLYNGVQRIIVGNFWSVNVTADSGAAYGNLVGYRWLRDTTQVLADGSHPIVVYSSGGNVGLPRRDPTGQKVLGNYNPDWVAGINNTFSYKGVSLSLAFDGQKGGNVYSVTKWFGDYSGVLKATLLGRENDARLSFDLPSSLAQHLGFSGASFAIVGHNLALWAKQDIIDPETAQDTGNRQGTENAQLPTARSIGFTLSVRP